MSLREQLHAYIAQLEQRLRWSFSTGRARESGNISPGAAVSVVVRHAAATHFRRGRIGACQPLPGDAAGGIVRRPTHGNHPSRVSSTALLEHVRLPDLFETAGKGCGPLVT
jgi:hypothetical protein